MGVAGSYLAARLSAKNSWEIHAFDGLSRPDSRCAWGGSKYELSKLASQVGLDYSKYIFFEGKNLKVIFEDAHEIDIPLVGLTTFDKNGFEEDLEQVARKNGVAVHRGASVTLKDLSGFDVVFDATGVYRNVLPKLKNDMIFPNLEYRVEYGGSPPFRDFTVFPYHGLGGYGWFFPLREGEAHVGGGDRFHRQKQYVELFMRKYGGVPKKTIARPVRMLPPSMCEPIALEGNNHQVVGVGESIGCVFPLLGEGIIPSLQSVDVLMDSFSGCKVDVESYRRGLRKKFFYFEPIFRAIIAKWKGNWAAAKAVPGLIPSFIKVKAMEKRFGFQIRLTDLVEIFNST